MARVCFSLCLNGAKACRNLVSTSRIPHLTEYSAVRTLRTTSIQLHEHSMRNDGDVEADNPNLGKIINFSLNEAMPMKRTVAKDADESEDDEVLREKLKYVKLDHKSKVLSKYLTNVKSKKKREESGKILLEGKRLIQDAMAAGFQPQALFFSRISDVNKLPLTPDCELFLTPYRTLQLWSDVETTQGVLGIFAMPNIKKPRFSASTPLTIICDNVRDPGNMGSILRTSAAVGCHQVILIKGCVDLWEPKVLRTAAGCHFRLQIVNSVEWLDLPELLPKHCRVYLADSNVPQNDSNESDESIDIYEISESGEKMKVDADEKRTTPYQKRILTSNSLELVPYSDANYTSAESLVLVIGGETEGLSNEAFNLANEMKGSRVYIPLENGVESLNSGTALGILAYEMVRQRSRSQSDQTTGYV